MSIWQQHDAQNSGLEISNQRDANYYWRAQKKSSLHNKCIYEYIYIYRTSFYLRMKNGFYLGFFDVLPVHANRFIASTHIHTYVKVLIRISLIPITTIGYLSQIWFAHTIAGAWCGFRVPRQAVWIRCIWIPIFRYSAPCVGECGCLVVWWLQGIDARFIYDINQVCRAPSLT